ncbi:3-oxoacyl-[acyl-carrier-protein] synthase-1 [Syntrophus gentianae]|uniref:3-oxoacyl-[acyl-carrier-protein] synthase-1 n=1 Tax=Syntrophus gentianae TaxID=43775 RepID=A0A1H7YHP7_9BACT|nr:beta-ketoacyl-[acyl-carrier-protein] synthase family protein [Syntrophus gentianae]SEM44817.1 3-oxoacyl-[acyl-carrier-protein] synthase-1 [Syntrophus gentianae]
MTRKRIFVTGMGMISPLGSDVPNTLQALSFSRSGLKPLSRFPAPCLLPVGEIPDGTPLVEPIPATHRYALAAAFEAVKGQSGPPESVIVGTTTGGMPLTEERLRQGVTDPAAYRYHATSSIAETIAQKLNCRGPVWTISTACSSGAVALALALELLRNGRFQRVLAGGADALCRLTYFGFSSLQVLDPRGGHPFDLSRKGLSLGEGAAMLFLVAAECPPEGALVELAGAGLSCDAWHPSSPQPEGAGARKAMAKALDDAGISPAEVDHVNLHGTGTPDNDSAEAWALRKLFRDGVPPIASVKGALGHSLAAAGAMEAVISAATILSGRIPPTVGFEVPDPELSLYPSSNSVKTAVNTVLSNSFGFGGNNAALVFRHPEFPGRHRAGDKVSSFSILGEACLTGVGNLAETLSALEAGRSCSGQQDTAMLSRSLDGRAVRRLKRLPRMVLSLAKAACPDRVSGNQLSSVFFGTGWGPLSETHDFLTRLFESGDRFASPFDFIGSVHNAPAGQVGMEFQATGPNLTLTGGEAAFEQALDSAALLAPGGEETLLVVGADEYSPAWTPLFDRSAVMGPPSDGGGALWLKKAASNEGLRILAVFLGSGERNDRVVENLAYCLGGGKEFCRRIGAVLVGLPAAQYREGRQRLTTFLERTGFTGPVLDYRKVIGEFASASAVATVLGVSFLREGEIPAALNDGQAFPLNGRGILVLGLGSEVSAVEILG